MDIIEMKRSLASIVGKHYTDLIVHIPLLTSMKRLGMKITAYIAGLRVMDLIVLIA